MAEKKDDHLQKQKEDCFILWLQYGDDGFAAIQRDMRRLGWSNWNYSVLYDDGEKGGKSKTLGWISKHGWERAKKEIEAVEKFETTEDEKLDKQIEQAVNRAWFVIQVKGRDAGKEDYQIHISYVRTLVDFRAKVKENRDLFGSFVQMWMDLSEAMPVIDKAAAEMLVNLSEKILDWAKKKYAVDQEEEIG